MTPAYDRELIAEMLDELAEAAEARVRELEADVSRREL